MMFERVCEMKAMKLVPSVVSAIRLASIPLILHYLSAGNTGLAFTLFVFALATDVADGFLARRLNAESRLGGYFDAAVDCALIGGIFLHLAAAGAYPWWAFALIAAMFAQFVATSALSKVMYDPFGKYYGGLLFGAAGLSILFPGEPVRALICSSLVGATVVQVAVRAASLAGRGCHPLLLRMVRGSEAIRRLTARILAPNVWSGSVFFMGDGGGADGLQG
jgi:phosphatidylglycerophosphate synthase